MNSSNYPKISIVTPSYNQGHFIEETILSVIGQHYPNLEYIIIDGGSTDNTVEIIKKYEKLITYWISEKDNGQAEAINKGFSMAKGQIFGWLNSDDMYLPGTLKYISEKLNIENKDLILGNCFHMKEGSEFGFGSNVQKSKEKYDIKVCDFAIQPSSFWTKNAWQATGQLTVKYNFVFDWEWFIRATTCQVNFILTDKYLSVYRLHDAHKTGIGGKKRMLEINEIYRLYLGKDICNLHLYLYENLKAINLWKHRIRKLKLGRFQHIIINLRFPVLRLHNLSLIDALTLMI